MYQTFVSTALVKSFLDMIDTEKRLMEKDKGRVNPRAYGFCTKSVHENKAYKAVLNEVLRYIPNGERYKYTWCQLIHYLTGGNNPRHIHRELGKTYTRPEDYSFVLYLTSCAQGGETVFEIENEPNKIIKPEKGKLVFFSAHIPHWGEPTIDNKKVAVGALQDLQRKTTKPNSPT
jgi:hypothetical protein